jgi:hypothetical protein
MEKRRLAGRERRGSHRRRRRAMPVSAATCGIARQLARATRSNAAL